MKRFLIFVVIICMALWLYVGAQENVVKLEEDEIEEELTQPTALPVTRLNVTLIDELNDQVTKLENSIVQLIGELHIAEDSFNYSNTFTEGDRYSITIWVKAKK